jgi:hypothetical protein
MDSPAKAASRLAMVGEAGLKAMGVISIGVFRWIDPTETF